jgi:glycosyltransferase involved in cell wall biosynthesis
MTTVPLVWVVTPVHNGERYLAECIESVLAQTYDDWEYLIVDNCSTDGTSEIVRAYCDQDARVRLEQSTEFLPIIANWNRALRMIPSAATYCKVVHADDVLLPQCLERMVDVAERHPSVAFVSSYALWGDEIRHRGVTYPSEVVDGRQICRAALLGQSYVFGSPSSLLLRATDVRTRPSFYNEDNFHADTEACFDLLVDAELGFVHEVLTRTRLHEEAMTPLASKIGLSHHGWLMIHLKFGRWYLTPREYYTRLVYRLRKYALYLVKSAIKMRFRDPRFREHHVRTLRFLLRVATSHDGGRRRGPAVPTQPPLLEDGAHDRSHERR